MRRLLPVLALATGVTFAGHAGALTCDWWRWHIDFGGDEVPVDITPWVHASCGERFDNCRLASDTHLVAVTARARGEAACELASVESAYGAEGGFLVYFTPHELLLPGQTYRLSCAEDSEDRVLTTRANDEPAAPPEPVLVQVRYVQGDDGGCCGGGDMLAFTMQSPWPQLLDEGGLIEVLYPNGELVPLITSMELPGSLGPLELTPIAADGTRGSTTRITRDDIHVEPVYIPCSVSSRGSGLAMWLLVPLLWIGAHRLRRSS